MATDANWIDEASAVLRKLFQAHEREFAARQVAEDVVHSSRFREPAQQALTAATAVTDAAIAELLLTLDDRMQDHLIRLAAGPGRELPVSQLPESGS